MRDSSHWIEFAFVRGWLSSDSISIAFNGNALQYKIYLRQRWKRRWNFYNSAGLKFIDQQSSSNPSCFSNFLHFWHLVDVIVCHESFAMVEAGMIIGGLFHANSIWRKTKHLICKNYRASTMVEIFLFLFRACDKSRSILSTHLKIYSMAIRFMFIFGNYTFIWLAAHNSFHPFFFCQSSAICDNINHAFTFRIRPINFEA